MAIDSISSMQSSMVSSYTNQSMGNQAATVRSGSDSAVQLNDATKPSTPANESGRAVDRVTISAQARQQLASENAPQALQAGSPVQQTNRSSEAVQEQQQRVGSSRSVVQALNAYNTASIL